MKRFRTAFIAPALALLLAGCGVGIIYTHTVQPLTIDMHRTPAAATANGQGDIKHLVLLYPPFSFAWDSAAIGDVANKNNLKEIYYADLETFSVLHIWNRYTVHVYGK